MIAFPNAKINLGLHITEKRPDGFHNLETIFIPVGWSDVLEFVVADELQLTSTGIQIPGNMESNLVIRAYRLLQKDFGLPALKIHLHKLIPSGSGLGGGSSDAAFMLRLLNKTFDLKISENKLLEYSAVLGSDCPFFILNKPVYATGRGDIMNIINPNFNNTFILIAKPPIEVSTAEAFQNIVPEKSNVSLVELLRLPIKEWKYQLINQFEPSVFQQYPEIGYLKQKFYELGADYASMSGSGSCVFGIFNELPSDWETQFPIDYLTYSQQFKNH